MDIKFTESDLLRIVRSWDIKRIPEYRGFRCAICQRYVYKAWHYWLLNQYFRTPVHICKVCQNNPKMPEGQKSSHTSVQICSNTSWNSWNEHLSGNLIDILTSTAKSWRRDQRVVYRQPTCDSCSHTVHKAFHIWFRTGAALNEGHLCTRCSDEYGLPPGHRELPDLAKR